MNRETNELQNTLFTQTLMTYGVMVGVFVVLFFIKASIPTVGITAIEVAALIMGSFAPTTITFIGSLVFEYDFIKNNKRVATEFLVAIVWMSLLYIAFECIKAFDGSEWASLVVMAVGIVTMIYSMYRLNHSVKGYVVKDVDISTETADGYICARRRRK